MSPLRLRFAVSLAALLAMAPVSPARAVTPNGQLQIVHLDVGQGDGALLISPLGQTVLIDEGPSGVTPAMGVSVLNQLRALGVTRVDHHFASHYHADHIGNFVNISRFSSNTNFLAATTPRLAVISCGNGNSYGHPTSGALGRLHTAGVKNYWTETGAGVAPWNAIATGIANTGGFAWTVPAQPTVNARVRVVARDAAGNVGVDSSLTVFGIDYWTIVASTGVGGSIAPSGVVNVAEGASSSFTIGAGAGWQILDVRVDGVSAGSLAAYQFTGVAASHSIASSFLDVAAPSVAVTSPAGGEVWGPGTVHDVTWTATDNHVVDSVSVQYSLTGLAGRRVWHAENLLSAGTHTWTWDGRASDGGHARAGYFFVRLTTPWGTRAERLVRLR